jgi:hypothetical protein
MFRAKEEIASMQISYGPGLMQFFDTAGYHPRLPIFHPYRGLNADVFYAMLTIS